MPSPMRRNERLAFWLAPLFSTLPLIPVFGMRSSPLFLGRLMGDPIHPMNGPVWGAWLSAVAVVFDGCLLAYVSASVLLLPAYLFYRNSQPLRFSGVLALYSLSGVGASQLVHFAQHFQQPLLKDFANSWRSPVVGCLCGLTAGLFYWLFSGLSVPRLAQKVLYSIPVAVLAGGSAVLVTVARAWNER